MRIRKCDKCGVEVVEKGEGSVIPSDKGWTELHGTELSLRWTKDLCPGCTPIPHVTKEQQLEDIHKPTLSAKWRKELETIAQMQGRGD